MKEPCRCRFLRVQVKVVGLLFRVSVLKISCPLQIADPGFIAEKAEPGSGRFSIYSVPKNPPKEITGCLEAFHTASGFVGLRLWFRVGCFSELFLHMKVYRICRAL